ncbi:DMT family transporter [Methyloparacoccus murrellii]
MQADAMTLRRAWLPAFLGVAGFSLTLPATRMAVLYFDPWLVALGRGVLAAGLAAMALLVTRQPRPKRHQLGRLALVAVGVVIGFPVLSAWAMQQLPASHGSITLSLTPLATACFGTWLARERLPARFWIAALCGAGAVFGFALDAGGGKLRPGDLWLFAAALLAALGYAEGARLTRSLGGWQVISWALVLAAPWLLLPLCWLALHAELSAPPSAWGGFVYVAVVSQFLAFVFWYRGLALGGIARMGQLQLLQPFLTLGACAGWLGEPLTGSLFGVAAIVVTSLWVSQRAPARLVESRPDGHRGSAVRDVLDQEAVFKRHGQCRRGTHGNLKAASRNNHIPIRNDHEAL